MNQFKEDLEYIDTVMDRLANRSDIWQDRIIYGMAKVLRDILVYLIKRAQFNWKNSSLQNCKISVRITWLVPWTDSLRGLSAGLKNQRMEVRYLFCPPIILLQNNKGNNNETCYL